MGTDEDTDKTKTVSVRGMARTQTRLDSQWVGKGKDTDKTKTVSGWGQERTKTRLRQARTQARPRQSVGGDVQRLWPASWHDDITLKD